MPLMGHTYKRNDSHGFVTASLTINPEKTVTERKDDTSQGFGRFEGYASTFGNTDRTGDVIAKGAFSGTDARRVRMLWDHNTADVLGVWDVVAEDAKGLFVQGSLNLEVAKAREAYALLKQGAIGDMSVGFKILDRNLLQDPDQKDDEFQIMKREITKAELLEVSLVAIPANEQANVTDVKSFNLQDFDKKTLERELATSIGMSRRDAQALIAGGWDALQCKKQPDVSDSEGMPVTTASDVRDSEAAVLMNQVLSEVKGLRGLLENGATV